ncbi:winged helix DNA-binding domain-containing protein [Actinomycetaceae bacterium L2_0104]
MSTAEARRRISQLRMVAQRLVGEPWDSPAEATRAMMCLQGQDWPGVLVSLALRTRSRSLGDVHAAFNSGEIVRSWPQRGTLHVLPAEDVGWYLGLTALPRLLGQEKRRSNHGIESKHIDDVRDLTVDILRSGELDYQPDTGGHEEVVEVAAGSSEEPGAAPAREETKASRSSSASRAALIQAWQERGVLTTKDWAYYLLHHLCVEGVLVQGPVGADGNQMFVLAEDWIANPRHLERQEAVDEVVRRYLTSHGPASRKDINWWSQLPLREIDIAIESIRPELTGIVVDGQTYWVHNSVLERAEGVVVSRSLLMLPGFDELILGYGSRWMTIPEQHADALVPGNNGMFRKSIILGGTAVGFWRQGRKSPIVELFAEPTPAFEKRLEKAFGALPGA